MTTPIKTYFGLAGDFDNNSYILESDYRILELERDQLRAQLVDIMGIVEQCAEIIKSEAPKAGAWWKWSNTEGCMYEIHRNRELIATDAEGGMRLLFKPDSFCPKCSHDRDGTSISSIAVGGGVYECQICGAGWREV